MLQYLIVQCMMLLISALFAGVPANFVSAAVPVPRGRLVLKLPFVQRGPGDSSYSRPYSLSELWRGAEEDGPRPDVSYFVGTDWKANIYFIDQLAPNYGMLKAFDKNGKFVQSWEPMRLSNNAVTAFGVTKSGYIWVGVPGYSDVVQYRGLPLIAFRFGKRTPVVDWRDDLPKKVASSINTELRKLKSDWKPGMVVDSIYPGSGQVLVKLRGEPLGSLDAIAKYMDVTISGDASTIYGTGIESFTQRSSVGLLSEFRQDYIDPNDASWFSSSDVKGYPPSNYKPAQSLWVWKTGSAQGQPVYAQSKAATMYRFLGKPSQHIFPDFSLDSDGRIYLIWKDESDSSSAMDGEISSVAVAVLGRNRHLVARLPWTSCGNLSDTLVVPIPGSSGFYRVNNTGGSLQIYRYDVPK